MTADGGPEGGEKAWDWLQLLAGLDPPPRGGERSALGLKKCPGYDSREWVKLWHAKNPPKTSYEVQCFVKGEGSMGNEEQFHFHGSLAFTPNPAGSFRWKEGGNQ